MSTGSLNDTYTATVPPSGDYDADYHLSWTPDDLMSGIYIAEGCIGVIGNMFVILVIFMHTKMRKQLTNFLIINQSTIDGLSSILMIFVAIFADRGRVLKGVSGILLCRLWYSTYPLWAGMVASTFNLLAITLERYACIVHPIMYKNKVSVRTIKVACVGVWLTGYGLQVCITILPAGLDDNDMCNAHYFWPSEIVQKAIGVATIVVCFIIPLLIMIFCYAKMIIVLKSRITNVVVEPETSSQTRQKDQTMVRATKNVFKTLIIVTVCFTLCWTPNQILFLNYNLGYKLDFTAWYYHLTVFLVYLNCCCNPLIYVAQYEQFQAGVKKLRQTLFSRVNPSSVTSTSGITDSSIA